MKTILPIFTVILWLGVLATPVTAGSVKLRDPQSDRARTQNSTVGQPRKQLQAPPATQQTTTRTSARPVLKKTESSRPLPGDDRKKNRRFYGSLNHTGYPLSLSRAFDLIADCFASEISALLGYKEELNILPSRASY